MKKFAVILAGNGVFDGSEIHEAVLTLLAIDKAGATYQAFAPDTDQFHVINHFTKKPTDEKRNVLVEAARLVRGQILPLTKFNANDFDALLMPGGFGVAKNLCTYASQGPKMTVNPEVEACLVAMHNASKPIGALCISPVILAKLFTNASVTIGTDATTEEHIKALGGKNIRTSHGDVVVDQKNKLFTAPCYMLEATISEIALDAENLVNRMMDSL